MAARVPDTGRAQPPGVSVPQPGPGAGWGPMVRGCGSPSAFGPEPGGSGKGRRLAGGPLHSCGGAVSVLANVPLQVSEEFIDDDPAEISFFAGGSEAFGFPYGGATPQRPPHSARSSPDRYSTEAVHLDAEDSCDSDGEPRSLLPEDTSELLRVKAQASLLQSLLSPSDTSSLRNSPSQSSSLGHLPLLALSMHTPSSAGQSEASSMANFPAGSSVRSESSSAFQFSDILDQLEQLSGLPAAGDGSSHSEAESWDSEAESPLDVSLFLGHRFAQPTGDRLALVPDWQSGGMNVVPGEWTHSSPN